MSEIQRVEEALRQYRLLPEDVWIGRNGPADKVTWLIRRLEGTEAALARLRPERRLAAEREA